MIVPMGFVFKIGLKIVLSFYQSTIHHFSRITSRNSFSSILFRADIIM